MRLGWLKDGTVRIEGTAEELLAFRDTVIEALAEGHAEGYMLDLEDGFCPVQVLCLEEA